MTRKVIEGLIFPDQLLGAIGHVLMTEWPGADGVKHRSPLLAVDLIVHPDRSAVSIPFDLFGLAIASEDYRAKHPDVPAKHRLEIFLDLFTLRIRHGVLSFSKLRSGTLAVVSQALPGADRRRLSYCAQKSSPPEPFRAYRSRCGIVPGYSPAPAGVPG